MRQTDPTTIGRLEAEIVLLRSQLLTAQAEVERLRRGVSSGCYIPCEHGFRTPGACPECDLVGARPQYAAIVRLRGAMTTPAPVAVAPMKDDACE